MLIETYATQSTADESWNIPPLPSREFGVEKADQAWVDDRLTPHPVASYFEPVALSCPAQAMSKTYIRCARAPGSLLERSVARARANNWRYVELDAPHDAMITHPEMLAAVLADCAG